MIFKIFVLCLLACLSWADNSVEQPVVPAESAISFETSHKRPGEVGDDGFQTSHRISHYDVENMNLLPTKEKPELNPVLSALINEDVMKSIEAKRAIEEAELEIIKSEIAAEEERLKAEAAANQETVSTTEKPVLTTGAPPKKATLDGEEDINVGFVDQAIALDTAGTENNKKSRIEIKKGPNGQDYEYEYVYYYDDEGEDEEEKGGSADEKDREEKAESRGKSRYTNIERSTAATPNDNSLVTGKAKGRSSNVEENIETERLPHNTRFPSRGKSADVTPTPAIDSLDSAAEKKKISVKRPSLELVDSETFNTDEKQAKGSRNAENDTKTAIAIEQEMAAAQATKDAEAEKMKSESEDAAMDDDEDVEQTTPAMEKAAFDLYAILANENNNMEMTTDSDMDVTTMVPDTTDMYGEDMMTTMVEEESSTTTTTTTTTTTEPTTTTTTTTTTQASLFGGKRGGASGGRNRFKLKSGGASTTTTTEGPAAAEAPKTGKNRFSRPPLGGRPRPGARTTAAPAAEEQNEEEVSVKEVKPVSSGFGRNKPRNRFNLRGSTTAAAPVAKSDDAAEETVSSTTARAVRGRPTLNLRGRSRTTTSKTTPADEEAANDSENSVDEKAATPAAAPTKASRFNLNRAAGGRLPGRGKLGRTTEAPAATEDSDADSSHHNDVKGEGEESGDKPAEEKPSANLGGLNRLKTRPRIGGPQKTDSLRPKAAPAPPRKVNPLLAKKRMQLSTSTTESTADEDGASSSENEDAHEEAADANEENKDEALAEPETTTKQQPRGLGLLGQRRPLRKPGTLL
ncbi:uncharacterized abhydrolase domain-containing protein DDB_G0269086 [Stomoxys calcitrans]|uniref:uncharacterized abhydrolase domain-containing protein DDB_G0269086 n=1 Tax=Stomoxys calcitrans TaxID=35570 RepID=UPI0027E2F41A|nr:uncharacterized abhydrolase domain-containing protein DDB_G0269086 [Stomoxys calcitrans]